MRNYLRRVFGLAPKPRAPVTALLVGLPPVTSPIAIDPDGNGVVLMPSALVVATRREFQARVLDALERGATSLVVDCEGCGYIDTTGLGVLLSLSRKAREKHVGFALSGLNDDARRLFDITNIGDAITVLPREATP